MPKMSIKRSVLLNASVDKVYAAVADFHHWPNWSPWLIMEPGVKVATREDGKFYEWEGNRTGSGNMTVLDEKENEWIDYDLQFLKPWKSKAHVRFEIQSKGEQTEVSWYMNSKLPFFLFWMKKMMETYVGIDYERGLRLLTDYVEDGKVHSQLDFSGTEKLEGFKYIGVNTNCTKETMGKKMAEDLPKVMEVLSAAGQEPAGPAFTQYHKWNMVKDDINYTSGIAVKEIPTNLPSGIISGEIPATSVYTIAHTGPYHHLGNAWSTLYTMMRNKEFKSNKKLHAFETYHNKPGDVGENELLTKIHFPILS